MSTVIDAVLRLRDDFTARLRGATQQLSEHERVQQRVSKSITATGQSISGLGSKMMLLGAPIATAATAGLKLSSEFQDGLAKVSTLCDKSVDVFGKMRNAMVDASNETGTSVQDMAEATYQAISASVDASKAVDFVKVAAIGAKAGFTDNATAVDGLTSTLNAFKLQTEDAGKVMDQFLMTQNLGKTSFGEMAQSIGQVAPIASTLGMKTQDLLASIAELTKVGIKTPEAFTGMKAALSNIMKPSSEASKAAQKLGLDFSAAHLKSVGWTKFLEEIKEKTGGNTDTLNKLFGSVEAVNSVLAITENMDDYKDGLDKIGNSGGAAQEAFDKLQTPAEKTRMAMNQLKNAGMELGAGLGPILLRTSQMIKAVAAALQEMSPEQRQLLVNTAQFILLGGMATKALGAGISIFGKWRGEVVKVAAAIGRAGGVLPAIQEAGGLFGSLGRAGIQAGAMIRSGIGSIGNVLIHPFASLHTVATGAFNVLKSGGSMVVTVFSKIGGVLHAIPSLFTTLASAILHPIASIKTLFTVFVNGFKMLRLAFATNPVGLALLALTLVIAYVIAHWKTFEQVIKTVWEHVSGTITAAIDRVKPVFERLWQAVQGAFEKIKNALNFGEDATRECGARMSVVINTLGSVFSAVFAVICTVVEVAVTIFMNSISTAITLFGDLIQFLNCVFVGDWRGAWEAVKQIFTDIVESIKQTFSDVINSLSGMLDRIIGKSGDAKAAVEDAQAADSGSDSGSDSDSADNPEEHWTGSTWFKGGQTWIHEQGPEIVTLPTGSQIIPHSESLKAEYQRGLLAGQAVRPLMNAPTVNTLSSILYHNNVNNVTNKVVSKDAPSRIDIHMPSKNEAKQPVSQPAATPAQNITIAKIADSVVVRQDSDIDRIADALVFKLKQYAMNGMAGAVV